MRHTSEHEGDERKRHEQDERCILCEAIIEVSDHEVYFATGYCRYCTEVLEDETSSAEK
ncbi:hypothetical protein [Rhizomicrobium electricum]|uniref:Uncharacterized protein n=1 Tax=Rhizomicrobium electricum TaxID=480070 RepID=A0ABP3P850_9PROT|nr:hypothetical protein [Rhizomicrobium electricum]NIJ47678.1 hypothetical protein [Rhizomicrobium electricum]